VLEIGCGAGGLLRTLAQRGFTGVGLELSEKAARMARETLGDLQGAFDVRVANYEEMDERFDLVMALDVLEHIADDEKALVCWRRLVTPEGLLLLSVPAHARRWGSSDVAVGHFRRYEKGGLRSLLERSGFTVGALWCYGFPLSNIVAKIGDRLAYPKGLATPGDQVRRTKSSGLMTRSDTRLIRWLAPPLLVVPFAWLQMPFVSLDLGTGYVARARPTGPASATGGRDADG
jgi:SAM-dependent methyltransferase